jgi:hypothetical protein
MNLRNTTGWLTLNRSLAQFSEAQRNIYQADDQKTNYCSCSKHRRMANNRLYTATNVLRVALPLRLSMWKSPIGHRAVTTVRWACANNRIVSVTEQWAQAARNTLTCHNFLSSSIRNFYSCPFPSYFLRPDTVTLPVFLMWKLHTRGVKGACMWRTTKRGFLFLPLTMCVTDYSV